MQTISYNGIRKEIPNCWTEIKRNRKLLLFVLSLFFNKFTKQEILHQVIFKVLNISKPKQLLIIKDIEKNPNSKHPENLYRLSEIIDFIVEQPLEITENLFPKIKNLHAPKSVFGECTAWEYALAEKTYFDFAEKETHDYLNKLISILYRPKKLFKPERKKFDEKKSEKYQKRIAKIPFEIKWCIFRWFTFQREQIIKAHPFTFSGGSSGNNEKPNIGAIWTDTILAMSTVGDEDKTANTKLSIILRRIENENKAYQKLKNKTEIN